MESVAHGDCTTQYRAVRQYLIMVESILGCSRIALERRLSIQFNYDGFCHADTPNGLDCGDCYDLPMETARWAK